MVDQTELEKLESALDEETGTTREEIEAEKQQLEEENRKYSKATLEEVMDAIRLVNYFLRTREEAEKAMKKLMKEGKTGSPFDSMLGGMMKNMIPRGR